MKKYIKAFILHPLITGSTVIFIGSFLISVLNWLFNVLVGGRNLITPSEYGLYTTLLSLSVLVGVFSTSLTGIFAKFSARFSATKNINAHNQLLSIGIKFSLGIGFLITILLLFSSFVIARFLHITDMRLIFLTFFIICITIFLSLPLGILQGQMRFLSITILNGLMALFKIAIVLALIFMGFRLLGVMVGVLLSSLIGYVIGVIYVFRHFQPPKKHVISNTDFFKDFKKYSTHFFLATLGASLLANTDMLLVRHFFDPVTVGHYAALSLMGKSIFYFISPIFFVFFPLVAQKKEKKESYLPTLFFALSIVLIACLSLSFVYFVFPQLVLRIFFPSKSYAVLANLLGPYSLYMTIFSLVTLLNTFLLSIGKTYVYIMNLVAAVLFVILILLFHRSLYQIITILFLVSIILLFSFIYLLYGNQAKKIFSLAKENVFSLFPLWQEN